MSHPNWGIRIRQKSIFPPSLFFVYLGVLFLMSGIHTGLIVGMNSLDWPEWAQVYIPLLYWGAVAVGLTLFTRQKIRKTYEEPMLKLAAATRQVAEGDFSVYIAPTHTADKADYLDQMIVDFDKMVEELGSIETLKTDFSQTFLTSSSLRWRSFPAMQNSCKRATSFPQSRPNRWKTFAMPPDDWQILSRICSN